MSQRWEGNGQGCLLTDSIVCITPGHMSTSASVFSRSRRSAWGQSLIPHARSRKFMFLPDISGLTYVFVIGKQNIQVVRAQAP